MTEEEINAILYSNAEKRGCFKKLSINELIEIMDFCKKKFKNDKNNWSIIKAEKYCKDDNNHTLSLCLNLQYFYTQYGKRKRKVIGFEKFIKALWVNTNSKGIMKPIKKKPTIANTKDLKKFLEDMKVIKSKYLICNNNMLIEIISKNIETGYTLATLRGLYYKKNR